MISHHNTTFPSQSEYFVIINTACLDGILKLNFQQRALCLTFLFLCSGLNMSEAPAAREKRLATGARVSGSFGDFYINPDPNIRRRKRQRIYGIVTGACGPRKYTVQFDCGKTLECFSNTLRLESCAASLSPPELHDAISQVERENTAPIAAAAAIIEANEVAANDIEEEDHLPDGPEDDEDENAEEEATSDDGEEEPAPERGADDEGNEQRPVGTVQEAPAEDLATYAGRKQAAIRRIQALLGETVVIKKGRSEQLEWTVVAESHPSDEDIQDNNCDNADIGLKYISEITRANYDVRLAHLFLHLTFKVSKKT